MTTSGEGDFGLWMGHEIAGACEFTTERLDVGDWHQLADASDIDLATIVERLLTPASTTDLPPSWQGQFDSERARSWIAERDAESPTLLAIERSSGLPVALLVLFEVATQPITVRLGYVVSEDVWGQGLATELITGLVAWTQSTAEGVTLLAGVASTNLASQRVLTKAGFVPVSDDGEELLFRL